MARKKIAVLTMTSAPRLMLAGVEDGQVHIIKCDELERSINSLKSSLPAILQKIKDNGFVLLVDEVVSCFSSYGRAVRLSDLDTRGKPIVVSAMEAYQYLHKLGGISFPSDVGGKFEISPSLVEEIHGTDGKVTYKIDWSELRPETYALLLTIYAATQDSISDKATLEQFLKTLAAKNEKPQSRAFNIFSKINGVIESKGSIR